MDEYITTRKSITTTVSRDGVDIISVDQSFDDAVITIMDGTATLTATISRDLSQALFTTLTDEEVDA